MIFGCGVNGSDTKQIGAGKNGIYCHINDCAGVLLTPALLKRPEYFTFGEVLKELG
ncbi:MAG: hypothetical protein K2H52_13570 [Lachnospiraceae bacterium]|nr:hypothetical protein [Lachnospiraceae bacterium]